MIVELRAVPDCPNLPAARDLLRVCLAELGLPPAFTERLGDYRSPSVLIDGYDVTGADPDGSAACLLNLPSPDSILSALRRAMAAPADQDGRITGAPIDAATAGPVPADGRTRPGDAVRVDRPDRVAGLPAHLRAVYQRLLRHFAATGTAPTPADLSEITADAGLDPISALRVLADTDLIAVDEHGRLVAAYPFSPIPTAHAVTLGASGVYAMCAIDALGMPFMLDTDATVTSADPRTGEPITVRIINGEADFTPAGTVVLFAATGETGRSVDTACPTINFFASAASAHAWTAEHPHLTATLLDQPGALTIGRDIFGPLLR